PPILGWRCGAPEPRYSFLRRSAIGNALSIARPFQEILEQLVAFDFGQRPGARLSDLLLWPGRLLHLARRHLCAKIRECGICPVEAFPALYSGKEIGITPFRVAGRLQERVEF